MDDGIIKGTGNSRYLKSAISPDASWEEAREQLIAGTFLVDFNGINPAGWERLGTPNDKAHMLTDETAEYLGLDPADNPTVDDAFRTSVRAQATLRLQTIPNAAVALTLGSYKLTAAADKNGLADLNPGKLGAWAVQVTTPNGTYSREIFVENIGVFYVTFPALEDTEWADIDTVSAAKAHKEIFNVGDEKKIELTDGETITLRIEDFDHDDLVDGGKAPITFGFKDLMAEKKRMNASATNSGGYGGSEMRSTTIPKILAKFPPDVLAVVKPVNKTYRRGGLGAGRDVNTTEETLWPFAITEAALDTNNSNYNGEGTPYPLFTDNASRIKRLSDGSGSTSSWWTRTVASVNYAGFINVDASGVERVSGGNADVAHGVCLGFCV